MAINNYVETALDVLVSIQCESEWESSLLSDLKVPLSFVNTFYMCGKSWGRGKRCETILDLIEQTSREYEQKLQSTDLRFDDDLQRIVSEFLVCIQRSFLREMEDLYKILLDRSFLTGPSSPQEVKSLLDVMDSLLQNLEDLRRHNKFGTKSSHPIQDLENYVRFLKNLISFAISLGLEHIHIKDPLTCIVELVLDAARLTFMSWYSHHRELWYIIYQLVQRIKPVESKVCRMYVGVLQEALNFSLSSHHLNKPIHRLRLIEFVDSLLFLLSQLLFFGSGYGDVFKHGMQRISIELTSLNTFLREHHYKKLHDHTIHEAGIVICKAGIVICNLFPKQKKGPMVEELEPLILNLQNRFTDIKTLGEDAVKDTLMSASYYPQTYLLGFINFLLEKIKSVENDLAEDKRQSLCDDLSVLRSFLVEFDVQQGQNDNLQALRSRITAVAYETEFWLDSVKAGDAIQISDALLNTVTEEMKLIKAQVVQEASQIKGDITRIQNIAETHNKKRPTSEIPVVRLDDTREMILDQLTTGTDRLDIISIVGEPGLGKTTMAKEVYNDRSITEHFPVCSWCSLSQVHNKKHLLIEIMSGLPDCLDKDSPGHQYEDEGYLGLTLWRYLKGKRYLIVLDDVWDFKTWNYLKPYLPDDRVGSRILLTSQSYDVALQIKPNGPPHSLRLLNDDESWELFQQKLNFEQGRTFNEDQNQQARKIVELCKGLPLKIVLVAELLSQEKPIAWEEVAERLKRGSLLRETIELSYLRLPEYLKPCLLYFGAFKEDQEIHVQELLWLWMAEGFVDKNNAEAYLWELIQRSLVRVAKRTSGGSIKSCILDDHIYDFCRAKCKEEHFLHFLDGDKFEISSEPSSLYRLCVNSSGEEEDSTKSSPICPRLRSLIVSDHARRTQKYGFNVLNNFFGSKLLRVLVLNDNPSEKLQLVHLKYLAIRTGDDDFQVPPSFSNLSHLVTFIVTGSGKIYLPENVRFMRKLKHLCTRGGAQWVLPSEYPWYFWKLEYLSYVRFSSLQMYNPDPDIRTLKCRLVPDKEQDVGTENVFLYSGKLESLKIDCESPLGRRPFLFGLLHNLKSLSLSGLGLRWSEMSTIYYLRNLEVLKLRENAFTGEVWDMRRGFAFHNLRFLELRGLGLREWIASYDEFPSLQKLVLSNCHQLRELPEGLEEIDTLETIEVISCEYVEDSVKRIQGSQMQLGNEDLKIFIHQADKRVPRDGDMMMMNIKAAASSLLPPFPFKQ